MKKLPSGRTAGEMDRYDGVETCYNDEVGSSLQPSADTTIHTTPHISHRPRDNDS